MRHAPARVLGPVLLALGPAASAQQVFVVSSSGGPGVFSLQVQPAVDAASSGDIVLVRGSGQTYSGFTIAGKGVSVIADVGTTPLFGAKVEVQSIPAGSIVRLRGLKIVGTFGSFDPRALAISNAAGSVWLEDMFLQGQHASGSGAIAAEIENSASVVFSSCQIFGGNGAVFPPIGGKGGHALRSTASAVYLFDVDCTGGGGASSSSGGNGGDGAHVDDGSFFASGSTMRAGNGANATIGPAGTGGSGLTIGGTALSLGCTFLPGTGGAAPGGNAPSGVPVATIGSGTYSALAGASRHFQISSTAREGMNATLTFKGTPGEFAGFFVSPASDVGTLLEPFLGASLLNLGAAQAFGVGALPGSGTLSAPIAVPFLPPSLMGTTAFTQSLFFDVPPTYAVIGPASALTILDSSL